MKKVTFVGGPIHYEDRILEDNESLYKCYSPGKIENENTPSFFEYKQNGMQFKDVVITPPMEHLYVEQSKGSLIFIYRSSQQKPNH